jgi:hypothetical protein
MEEIDSSLLTELNNTVLIFMCFFIALDDSTKFGGAEQS